MSDPVLIVGAGPTGLTAALELSRLGVPVRLIDKMTEPATTSRAIGVQARTLELLEQRGLADAMVRSGKPGHGGSLYGGGKRILRLDFGHVASRYNYLLFVSQVGTERILREAAGRQGVAVEWGVELTGLAQDALSHDPSPVMAVLRHTDGTLEQAKAPWLISAEGAHSRVRTTLDLPFEGRTLDERYALGDLHLDGDLPDSDFHLFSSEHGFVVLFPMGGRQFRVVASHPSGKPEPGVAPSLDELQSTYDQRSHIPVRFHDMTWSSRFRINSRMISRLKVGRLLLGGDAAHIHSPAGAQGMNTGIQDMINLSWKLALVIQGKAKSNLLDTYEEDRLPVTRDVLFTTENLTGLIGSENHAVRSVFNSLGPYVGGSGLVQASATARMSQLALGYRHSKLSSNHPHMGSLHAGDRVPDLVVRHHPPAGETESRQDGGTDGRLLGLLNPSRFTLLLVDFDESNELAAGSRSAVRAYGDLVTTVDLAAPADKAARNAFEATLGRGPGVFLVRPDGYVGLAAGGHSAARRLEEYCGHWFASD